MKNLTSKAALFAWVCIWNFLLVSCLETQHVFPLHCSVFDLLLTADLLPSGYKLSSTMQPIPDATVNSAGESFYLSSHLISHAVYWYSDEKYSTRKFTEESEAAKQIENTANQPPKLSLDKNNVSADDYNLVCGVGGKIVRCIYVGRYGNYVTVLNSEISSGFVSFETYTNMVRIVDEKLKACK